MADRPIIFSAPMVLALLAGRKTMTRRLATSPLAKCQTGDRLWVREAWGHDAPDLDTCRRGVESDGMSYGPYYMADGRWADNFTIRKRPSIHMPRWASRLTLAVTSVKVERLQDISYDDCSDEGVICPTHGEVKHTGCMGLRRGWATLWVSLHGQASWDANPEVVALTFTVERRNIDAAEVLRR